MKRRGILYFMGRMEHATKTRSRRMNVENFLLAVFANHAIFALSTRSMVMKLKAADLDWTAKRDPRRRLNQTLSKMKQKGLITFELHNGKRRPVLTASGKKMAQHVSMDAQKIKKPWRWDRRWRLVIFDIAEERRDLRDRVRRIVMHMGFRRLQDSVWVYPYDCEDVIALLKIDLRIGRELLYIIADAIEFDRPLREHFRLPLV